MAKGMWPSDDKGKWVKCWYEPLESFEDASLALRFTLSLPVTSAVSPSHAELLWLACDVADSYKAITTEEKEILKNESLGR
ncbi:MAG: hypothetical protein U5N58_01625 [Actinomycetota bacterium]|nr:hypothetical protein [Actinomycetota bacterium]